MQSRYDRVSLGKSAKGDGGGGGSVHLAPSAIQGRVGPYKGLWYVDAAVTTGIQFRPSMRKYKLPHPCTVQSCIEVNKYSKPGKPGNLSQQVIRLLVARGVPTELIVTLFREHVCELYAALESPDVAEGYGLVPAGAAARETPASAVWMSAVASTLAQRIKGYVASSNLNAKSASTAAIGGGGGRSSSGGGGGAKQGSATSVCGAAGAGLPNSSSSSSSSSSSKIKGKSKIKFPVSKSRTCFLVADPTQVLQPGECWISLSGSGTPVPGDVVLVARSPCYHPSEILKLKVAALPEGPDGRRLAHLRDVLVLCTTVNSGSKRAPADLMQGGGKKLSSSPAYILILKRSLIECHPPHR